ncbi:hypothetical protein SLE2022_204150 [Rubroshorea leprosula]
MEELYELKRQFYPLKLDLHQSHLRRTFAANELKLSAFSDLELPSSIEEASPKKGKETYGLKGESYPFNRTFAANELKLSALSNLGLPIAIEEASWKNGEARYRKEAKT